MTKGNFVIFFVITGSENNLLVPSPKRLSELFLGVCDPPSTPKNGSYKALKRSPLDGLFRINTKIEYECNPGYAIKGGRKVATCLKRMNRTGWFPSEVPQCVGESLARQRNGIDSVRG